MNVIRQMIKHPRENAILWIALIILIVSIYVLATSSAANWRHMYCTANEAQAIECTAKGWW
jgi:hypothetical protein